MRNGETHSRRLTSRGECDALASEAGSLENLQVQEYTMSNIYEAMGFRNCQDYYNVRLVTTGPKRWGEATRDEVEYIHETRYVPEHEAEQEFDTWGASLAEAAASGLLDILQEPGWLPLALVSPRAAAASSKPAGGVIGVREIEQRFPADLEPDPWEPEDAREARQASYKNSQA